uniref:Uncharacterized protein n=1 Tax=Arundo donax TaxID=35708 RepID=A0A0A9FX41_ARUDO
MVYLYYVSNAQQSVYNSTSFI